MCSNSCFPFVVARELHDSCTESQIKTLLHNDLRICTEHFSDLIQILSPFLCRSEPAQLRHRTAYQRLAAFRFNTGFHIYKNVFLFSSGSGHDQITEMLNHFIEQITASLSALCIRSSREKTYPSQRHRLFLPLAAELRKPHRP